MIGDIKMNKFQFFPRTAWSCGIDTSTEHNITVLYILHEEETHSKKPGRRGVQVVLERYLELVRHRGMGSTFKAERMAQAKTRSSMFCVGKKSMTCLEDMGAEFGKGQVLEDIVCHAKGFGQ